MPVDDVASRPSAPPQPPPEPEKKADTQGSSSSASTEKTSGSSGTRGNEIAKQRNTDAFGSARGAANNNLQAAKPGAIGSAGKALANRFADRFESRGTFARAASAAELQRQLRSQPNGARESSQPLGKPKPVPPEQRKPDPQQQQRVEAEIARRLKGKGDAKDIAARLARRLGNGDMQRGMQVLEKALKNNRLNLGLAGIHGRGGGPRNEKELQELQAAMGKATKGEVDTVLDNPNGGTEGKRGEPNEGQLEALTEIANLGRELGIKLDVVSHSNGFNTLRTFLADNPNAKLGNITLVNPNIPPAFSDTKRAFRDMVSHSDNVHLITTRSDEAVPWSYADGNGRGDVWQQQVHAAALAGVQNITVLSTANHSVESVAQHLEDRRNDQLNLDFERDPKTGRTVPKDPEAWRRAGYTWSPERGFERIPPRRPGVPQAA